MRTLTDILALILLVCGIVASFILLFKAVWVDTEIVTGDYFPRTEIIKKFSPVGLAWTLGTFFSTIVSWAILKSISEILERLERLEEEAKGIEDAE